MADYDPFGMDEEAAAAEAAAPAGVTVTTTGKSKKPSKELKANISSTLYDVMYKKEPWAHLDVMQPDFGWWQRTCYRDDWRHRDVKLELGNGIAYVIFNRPNENNSLQDTISAGFNDAIPLIGTAADIRVAVLTGEGRMFCAGGDPKMWQAAAARARGEKLDGDGTVGYRIKMNAPSEDVIKHLSVLSLKATRSKAFDATREPGAIVDYGKLLAAKQWHTWTNIKAFTICLANGSAMGGGVGFASICDYVMAVKKAYFTTSEVRIGVIPATISPYVAARIGAANAKRFFATAENLKAEKAVPVGLVNEVVENMKMGHEKINGILATLTKCSPQALARIKELVCTTSGQPINEPIMYYTSLQETMNCNDKSAQEGLAAEAKGEPKPWEQDAILPLY